MEAQFIALISYALYYMKNFTFSTSVLCTIRFWFHIFYSLFSFKMSIWFTKTGFNTNIMYNLDLYKM